MSANEYVNTLFQYISDLFKRPPFIDCKNGVFPEEFIPTVKNIFKRLFRVYSHVYHHHLNVLVRDEFIRIAKDGSRLRCSLAPEAIESMVDDIRRLLL